MKPSCRVPPSRRPLTTRAPKRTRTRTPGPGVLVHGGGHGVVEELVEVEQALVDQDAGHRQPLGERGAAPGAGLGPRLPGLGHGLPDQGELLTPPAGGLAVLPVLAAHPVIPTRRLGHRRPAARPPAVRARTGRAVRPRPSSRYRAAGPGPRLPGRTGPAGRSRGGYRPAAARRASTRSVCSQVKSGRSRPKWPYAAVWA